MTLVRWLPFQELDTMERRLRRMLDDIGFAPPVVPPADIYETAQEYVFDEWPGREAAA